jgi:hypothetical protein
MNRRAFLQVSSAFMLLSANTPQSKLGVATTSYLTACLRFVSANKSRKPLPHVSELSHEEQLKLEDQNVVACLKYARENLGM